MKRAFIVCGAEFSGNRLVAGILVSAGCWGRGINDQPKWPEVIAADAEMVVVIVHHEVQIEAWKERFERNGYVVEFLLTVRDPWVQVRARSRAAACEHSVTIDRYHEDYRSAFGAIYDCTNDFLVVPYESLMRGGAPDRLLAMLGLKQVKPLVVQGEETAIRDENEKWYASEL